MAVTRITVPATTIGGDFNAKISDKAAELKAMCLRHKALMDSITDGGLTKSNLETAAEFLIPVGKGAAYYDLHVSIKSGVDAIADITIANLDAGD